MKKNISIILVIFLLLCLVSCKKDTAKKDGQSSTVEEIVVEKIEKKVTVSKPQTSQPVSEPQEQSKPTSTPTTQTFESTIATPKEVRFYKNGKYYVSTGKNLNTKVAKCIESWYKDYNNDNLPLTKTAVTEEMIDDIKRNETVVEICFNSGQEINLLGKINLEKTTRLLVPITGNHAYYVFRGSDDDYKYQNGLHNVKGSGLEKYFEGITFNKDVKNWQSTVIAPSKVTFYKDGMQTESTNKELNYAIARHIEEWFKYQNKHMVMKSIITVDDINYERYNTTAIELDFDQEFTFYGGIINSNNRKIFISLDGEHPNHLYTNDGKSSRWGNLAPAKANIEKNLKQFFKGIEFTPLTEEEKRWRSTVKTPDIEFYENGKLLGETNIYKGYELNQKIAQKIESWFYHKEEIPTVTVANAPLDTVWKNETYIKLLFRENTTFYGKQIVSEKSSYLIIPLTGEYAYHIFEGTYSEMSNVAINIGGSDLEQFFEEFKTNNND